MKKQNLKTGMIAEIRSGQQGLIVLDNCYNNDALVFGETNWASLDSYNENLMWGSYHPEIISPMDIVKIYKPNLPTGFLSRKSKIFDYDGYRFYSHLAPQEQYKDMELLWERKEKTIPEYTMEEIIRKVGFEFKIKK